MTGRRPQELTSYVALGDSFTEGMDDGRPDGSYVGWADRLAARLAADAAPGFSYANLAVRGKLLREVVAEQVPHAVQMRPDLVSIVAGTNDMLRSGFDADALGRLLRTAALELAGTGARVLFICGGDPRGRLPWAKRLAPRVAAYNAHVRETAAEVDGVLVDLWPTRLWDDTRLWAPDRLHLNRDGHERVTLAALEALGYDVELDWRTPLPPAARTPWRDARLDDAQWVRTHLAPWLVRRVRGQSSGDSVRPKRPELAAYGPDLDLV